MRASFTLAVLAVAAFAPCLRADEPKALDVWFVDVEGGAATLIVTPAGETVLIDCGNPGGRDAERIHKVLTEKAGRKRVDHLIVTHWHLDHYGGAGRLAQLAEVGAYWHRGIPETLAEDPTNFPLLIGAFRKASEGKDRVLNAGDKVPLKKAEGGPDLSLLCVCSSGKVIGEKPGAVENPFAKEHQPQAEDKSDNAKSLGFVLQYGPFRFLDLGDLTWNVEHLLVSPSDRIGPVDVFQVTHHGLAVSNNPVLVKTVNPRVAVYNNGARKGAAPSVTATLRRLPEIQAIYQLHRNLTVGAQENTDPELIANPDEKCRGESIRLSVAADGRSYTVSVAGGKPRRFETRGK